MFKLWEKVLDRNMFRVSSCARTHKLLCLCILRWKPDLFNPNKNTLLLWTGVGPNPEPVNFQLTRSLSSAVSLGARLNRRLWPKGGISYIPWCIASYYIIKLPNARDAISSTRTWQLNSSGKRLVLPIKLSVPLLCRCIYDFRFTIPNISLVKSNRVFWPPIMT